MKVVHTSGKRKKAIARASVRNGKGIIRINSHLLDHFNPEFAKIKIQEPLILAKDHSKKVDIDVSVRGGGSQAQAEACRLAIARGLVEFSKSKELKKVFLEYDRNLIVADTRNKEPCKPNDSKARAKRQKSYR
jgi:small subunit ribosomal protein S9